MAWCCRVIVFWLLALHLDAAADDDGGEVRVGLSARDLDGGVCDDGRACCVGFVRVLGADVDFPGRDVDHEAEVGVVADVDIFLAFVVGFHGEVHGGPFGVAVR